MSDQNQATQENPFVHLHVHTEFSLLDGLSKIDKVVARAKAQGMSALAITDHGTMHGVINFYRACKVAEIKPIIGIESYLAKTTRDKKDPTERQPYHLLLLAKNMTGYRNLLQLASEAQLSGFYGKPRVDKDLLAKYSEGVICTSGCLAAEIPRMFAEDKESEAFRLIGEYQDIFGRENFFLELQAHDIPELNKLNEWLIRYRGKADVPMLATNDVHYVLQKDSEAHDTLLCIQTGRLKNDQKRMRMSDASYYLRSGAEMWDLFGAVAPESLTNTVLVADMCNLNLDSKGYHLPHFYVPKDYDTQTFLRHLALQGAHWRYGDQAESQAIQERVDYELNIIHSMGFDTYFLIVWDLCQFARSRGIWWNVRGSGAGSVVAYCLGITSIDPIENALIFERFLNPGRVSMPDIDMDFPDDQRAQMIEYAVHKYGEQKVAAIITFGTLKARAAIKDVARALDYPLDRANALTQMVPAIPSHPVTLAQCLSDDPEYEVKELKESYNADPETRNVLDTALSVEGVARSAGTHAAGVIISDKPLVNYLPLHRPTSDNVGGVPIRRVTQFPMEICESIGLLKVDFLGLSTLSVMRRACELIERYHGIHYTLHNIPYRPDPDDPVKTRMVEQAFELIGSGEGVGIFQLESQGMRKMLMEMRPTKFDQIIAAISLYRPGPLQFIPTYIKRMHGDEEIEYLHPKLEPILKDTYGICVYQEQIQRIGADLFGYSLGDADLMRRAVSKKKAKDLAKHKETFMEKGPQYGVSETVAEKIFDQVEFFAAYGFNKSHAADYAVITCQTAFLKRHYPEEYYTALLSVTRDNIDDVQLFTADCRRMGVPILGPNLNASELDFTIEAHQSGKRGIRFGLGAIKGVGDKASQAILDSRKTDGRFNSLSDFARRVDLQAIGGRRPIEAMIKVGVFDDFGDRARMLKVLDTLLTRSKKHRHDQQSGQTDLFAEVGGQSPIVEDDQELFKTVQKVDEISERDRLDWEKDLLGLYISSHPLDRFLGITDDMPNLVYSNKLRDEGAAYNGRSITVIGMVAGIRTVTTKKGDAMAIITIEDRLGRLDGVCFPRTWAKCRDDIKMGEAYIFYGKGDTTRPEPQIMVDRVTQDIERASDADDNNYQPPSNSHGGYSNGNNGNGNGNGKNHANSTAVAEAVPVTQAVTTAIAAPIAQSAPYEPPPVDDPFDDDPDSEPPPLHYIVTVAFAPPDEATAEDVWMRRIERIYNNSIAYYGSDMLVFRIPDLETNGVQVFTFQDRIDAQAVRDYLSKELLTTERYTIVEQTES